MKVYYNEWDAYCAQWLRNLMAAGLIPEGDVDERSIKDVQADDLKGYGQCHFFAGIGGWPYALRLAGWPPDRPVWTGSCPCQPFSAAGKRKGAADERHLWPDFRRLIAERRPPVVFGEQVASKDGRLWYAGVRVDLEGMGYVVGAADLPACSAGAPHKRQRLWFVADGHGAGLEGRLCGRDGHQEGKGIQPGRATARTSSSFAVAPDSQCKGLSGGIFQCQDQATVQPSEVRRGTYGYPIGPAWYGEPELAVLVHGVSADVAATSAYGNAIVPQVAAEFVKAYMECCLE